MIRTLHRSRAVRALWAAFFLVSGSLAAPAAAQRVVRVGLHDAHPIAFRDAQTGEVRGFGVEVLQHIADEEQWDVQYVDGTWAECLAWLGAGELDLLFPILENSQRATRLDFNTEPMFPTWGRSSPRSTAASSPSSTWTERRWGSSARTSSTSSCVGSCAAST